MEAGHVLTIRSVGGNFAGSSKRGEFLGSLESKESFGKIGPFPGPSEGRTLVLCSDETGDKVDSTDSNVVHSFSMLSKGDPREADGILSYYQVNAFRWKGDKIKLRGVFRPILAHTLPDTQARRGAVLSRDRWT